MKTLVSTLVGCFLILVFADSFAQTEFRDGFIVDKNQQFVYGYIAFLPTPHSGCLFKATRDAAPTSYTTQEIEAYGVINGNHFRKRPVLMQGEDLETQVFMEAITDGTVSLYTVFERLFIERGSSFYELKNEKENLESYRSTVMSLMGDCEDVARRARKVAIAKSQLKELVDSYNSCASSGKTTFIRRKSFHGLGVFVGLDRTKFTMTATQPSFFNNQAFLDRTLATGGIQYTVRPKWSRYVGITTGISYNDQKFFLTGTDFVGGYTRVQTFRFNSTTLRLPVMLELGNFVLSKAQPYVKAGISLPILLKANGTLMQERETESGIYIDHYNAGDNFKEPILMQAAAGIFIPVGGALSAYSEIAYSTGKTKFDFNAPSATSVSATFRSVYFNLGILRKL